MKNSWRWLLLACLTGLLGAGCVTPPTRDYTLFREHMPRSILILPPLNESVDANASYSYLTVAAEALGERGYYVYPVAVIDEFMKDNGLPGPDEMHAVSLAKIDEIIGADAVLYITLEEFGQKFEVLSSTTRVNARASLVDVETGQELWTNQVEHAAGSGSSGGGLLGDILAAAITQVGNTATDAVHVQARIAHHRLVAGSEDGLLYGPRHPLFGTEELQTGLMEQPPIEADPEAPMEPAPTSNNATDDKPS